jgi:hypothetical protein
MQEEAYFNFVNSESEKSEDPMSPENIRKHEPTAVKRDKNQGTSGDPV